MNNNKIQILDCTLRDGGYYNRWDFDPEQAKNMIQALNRAGVDLIEVGYKSPFATDQYYGLFKYCQEEHLGFLSKSDPAKYAFMIDIKEFISQGKLDEALLAQHILPAQDSVFSWVRLATHFATVDLIPDFVRYFRNKGYSIGFNLMGGSLLSREQIRHGLVIAEKAQVDVFYLADSFGSFYPEDIRQLIRFIKTHYSGTIGIHTHDNQGMAYANTLAAIEEGVTFVDGTITGMGRGAGNLLLEQFLVGYAHQSGESKYNGNALLGIIASYIQPLKNQYQWGFSPTYMFSGLNNIHPTYCQNLLESGRYTMEEVSGALARIPHEARSKYSTEVLEKAVQQLLKQETEQNLLTEGQFFDFAYLQADTVVIVARGKEAQPHIANLLAFAQKRDYPVVECNPTGYLPNDTSRLLVILNQVRLNAWKSEAGRYPNTTLVSGFTVDELAGSYYYPFAIGEFALEPSSLRIPDYDAGFYALGLALKAGVKRTLLAGFDGFEDPALNQSKEYYLSQVAAAANAQGAELLHITPTRYQVFTQSSLYAL
jgi:4-hydroxy 2-oxovalerate aldolase